MKKLIEEIMNHCDGIIERSERMTSGNYMHNCAANKFSAKIIKSCVNNLVSGIKWQKGVPKEEGVYIITTDDGEVRITSFHIGFSPDIDFFKICVVAWFKLSDIEPYKL